MFVEVKWNANFILNLFQLEITSDNWFENVIKIYKIRKLNVEFTVISEVQTAYVPIPIKIKIRLYASLFIKKVIMHYESKFVTAIFCSK